MKTRIASSLVFGGIIALLFFLLIAVLYLFRLWITGFPPQDLSDDVRVFPIRVLPVVLVSGLIGSLAKLLGGAPSPAYSNRKMGVLLAMLFIVVPVGTFALLQDMFFPHFSLVMRAVVLAIVALLTAVLMQCCSRARTTNGMRTNG